MTDMIVVTSSKTVGDQVARVIEKHGHTPVVVDHAPVGTEGHIDWPQVPPEIVVLTAPSYLPDPVFVDENPHRAKKLKGRNRRKW